MAAGFPDISLVAKKELQIQIHVLNDPGQELSAKINAIQILYDKVSGDTPENYGFCRKRLIK